MELLCNTTTPWSVAIKPGMSVDAMRMAARLKESDAFAFVASRRPNSPLIKAVRLPDEGGGLRGYVMAYPDDHKL